MTIHPPRIRRERLSSYHGRRMTEAEYLRLPEIKPYLEYVDGVVLQKPMPNDEHAVLAAEMTIRLGAYRAKHGGRVGIEGRTRLAVANYRLPDVSYWAPGKRGGNDSIPTLAIEVRSPGQTLVELRAKCRAYRDAGVDACWIIDPVSRSAECFDAESTGVTVAGDGRLETAALPGFSLPLIELFSVLSESEA